MKQFLLLVFLTSSLTTFAQSKEHAGSYEKVLGGEGKEYFETNKLTLNPNGTFLFHYYRKIENRAYTEETKYGKGTWTSNKRLIFLKTEESDIDATHVLNLNNSKLRYDTKSPRDKSNRDIKTSVRFYESEISWMKGRTLLKDMTVSTKGQESKCCNTTQEVESFLNGKWAKKNEDNKEYHYSFKGEKVYFDAFKKNEEGVLEEINKSTATVKILKTEDGFKIEKDFDGLKTSYGIKHLDDSKLITVRRDGKESTLYRMKE